MSNYERRQNMHSRKLLFAGLVSVFMLVTPIQAQQVPFTVQAQVPAASAATFTVSRVTPGNPEVFTKVNTTNLDFGQLTLDTENGIFLPAFYWVIDVGSNGAGRPDLQVAYSDTSNPNGNLNNGKGLGGRGTITYAEVVVNPDLTQTVNVIRAESLAQSNTSGGVNENAFANGFLRLAVGLATGELDVEVGNAAPFTTGDNPGNYAGTVTLTTTFD